jgi:hypothetical protein
VSPAVLLGILQRDAAVVRWHGITLLQRREDGQRIGMGAGAGAEGSLPRNPPLCTSPPKRRAKVITGVGERSCNQKKTKGTDYLTYEGGWPVFLRTTVFEPSRPLVILLVEISFQHCFSPQ